jgi:hypothetical protein
MSTNRLAQLAPVAMDYQAYLMKPRCDFSKMTDAVTPEGKKIKSLSSNGIRFHERMDGRVAQFDLLSTNPMAELDKELCFELLDYHAMTYIRMKTDDGTAFCISINASSEPMILQFAEIFKEWKHTSIDAVLIGHIGMHLVGPRRDIGIYTLIDFATTLAGQICFVHTSVDFSALDYVIEAISSLSKHSIWFSLYYNKQKVVFADQEYFTNAPLETDLIVVQGLVFQQSLAQEQEAGKQLVSNQGNGACRLFDIGSCNSIRSVFINRGSKCPCGKALNCI